MSTMAKMTKAMMPQMGADHLLLRKRSLGLELQHMSLNMIRCFSGKPGSLERSGMPPLLNIEARSGMPSIPAMPAKGLSGCGFCFGFVLPVLCRFVDFFFLVEMTSASASMMLSDMGWWFGS